MYLSGTYHAITGLPLSWAALIFFLLPLTTFSEEVKDTASAKTFRPVYISAPFNDISVTRFISTARIQRSDIDRLSSSQSSDIVLLSPGVNINSYGGPGAVKTMNIRGTGGARNMIMINGVRLNSPNSGIVDLSVIPSGIISRVAILRSGASAMYGSNAIGGAVNFICGADSASVSASIGYGSYKDKELSAEYSDNFGNHNISIAAGLQSCPGNFDFTVDDEGTDKTYSRSNAAFENYVLTFGSNSNWEASALGSFVMLRNTVRDVPGAVVDGAINQSAANLDEREILAGLNYQIYMSDNSMLKISTSYKYSAYDYSDPDAMKIEDQYLISEFRNHDLTFDISHNYSVELLNNTVITGLYYGKLNGNMLDPTLDNSVERSGIFVSDNIDIDLKSISSGLKMLAAARADWIDGYNTTLSPMLALKWAPGSKWPELRLGASYNFRIPTFNEMYYMNYGNSELKPERSQSYTVQSIWLPLSWLSFDASLYYTDSRDQIITIPKSTVSFTADNLGRAITRGLEITANAMLLKDKLPLSISYTLQMATDETEGSPSKGKEIIYIPREMLKLNASFNYKYFSIGTFIYYSSYRYSMPDNGFSSLLQAYLSISAFAAYTFYFSNLTLTPKLEITNLTGAEYQLIDNYPMPGRTFRLKLSLKYK